ncbi:MAG: glucokinase [Gammaproteobacteria bacterium]|nr:glucokinase [Gammaproteobacteria bacterium]
MTQTIISCDIGRTKCAAGIIEYDPASQHMHCIKNTSVNILEAGSLEALIETLETFFGFPFEKADAICIGAAGQYDGEKIVHENAYPYPMHFAALARKQQWGPFAIVHDYTPIICATFTDYMSDPDNLKKLNTATIHPQGRRVALGLGTGLGMKDGVLFPDGNFWLGKNEIGHIGISTPPLADSSRRKMHCELLNYYASDTPFFFEKILSGPGTVRLYEFFYPNREKITPRAIWQQANDKNNHNLDEMLDAFAWYMGLFIGTVQLIFMPEGGVWITGGVALHYLDLFDRPTFKEGIHASPAYLSQRETYPLGILRNPIHAIIGGGYYAVKRLLTKNIDSFI